MRVVSIRPAKYWEVSVNIPSTAKVINHLMNGELGAAHLYWQAGGWCVERHLDGCADFLFAHADEELTHMKRMRSYLDDCDWPIHFDALPEPKINSETILELFETILEHEKKITDNINTAVKEAQAIDDHSTFEFLQWFVMEQREEIMTFQNIVDRIKLIGDGPQALYFVDTEIAKLAAANASAAGSAAGQSGGAAGAA